jgi:signal transduction histidine kinase
MDELLERDHELRASLSGIEAATLALVDQRDRMSSADVDQLALAIASEARRLRQMVAPRQTPRASFDLAQALRPAILMARCSGVVVRDAVPRGLWVYGRRDDLTQVVVALLDNARVHAAPSPVDIRVAWSEVSTTLYVEDRGPGIAHIGGSRLFRRGRRGAQSSGSGLGLSIARRLMADQAGSLKVETRYGGGASFSLTLPSCPAAAFSGVAEPAILR